MKNQPLVESFTDMAAMQHLLKQPLIRLYVGSTAGYGETQATLNVYHWLRHIGYAGSIEIIYLDEAVISVATLLGLPAKFTTLHIFELENSLTKLIALSYFEQHENEFSVCELVLTGSNIAPLTAASVKANVCISTHAPPFSNEILLKSGNQLYGKEIIVDTKVAGIPFAIPTSQQVGKKLSQSTDPKNSALAFLTHLSTIKNPPDFVSLYGMHINFRGRIKPDIIIPNIVNAFDFLNKKKSRIFLLFNDFSAEDTQQILQSISTLSSVIYIDIHDCHFVEKINTNNSANIIINIGSVPTDIFHYFVKQSVLLAAEGLSAQSLSMVTGTPFLHLQSENDLEPREEIARAVFGEQLTQQLLSSRQALANTRNISSTQGNIEIIAQYLSDSYDPTSLLAQFNVYLSEQFHASNLLLTGIAIHHQQPNNSITPYASPLTRATAVFNGYIPRNGRRYELLWPVNLADYTRALNTSPPSFKTLLAAILFEQPKENIIHLLTQLDPLSLPNKAWHQACVFSAMANKTQWVNHFIKQISFDIEDLEHIAPCENLSIFNQFLYEYFTQLPGNKIFPYFHYRGFFKKINVLSKGREDKFELITQYYISPGLNLSQTTTNPRQYFYLEEDITFFGDTQRGLQLLEATLDETACQALISHRNCNDIEARVTRTHRGSKAWSFIKAHCHIPSDSPVCEQNQIIRCRSEASNFFKPMAAIGTAAVGAISHLAATSQNGSAINPTSTQFESPNLSLFLFLSGMGLAVVCLLLYLVISASNNNAPTSPTQKKMT